ncbi:hypothetical protein [Propioniciclava flava]
MSQKKGRSIWTAFFVVCVVGVERPPERGLQLVGLDLATNGAACLLAGVEQFDLDTKYQKYREI